ncbi:cysteine-rich receptor-like protein kinase 27 [Branchiostoma floridae]|uniref:Cysteine-rich receptor-like protein kinase 27 n=1 Tax=Branchiostoma floridae TaxID=7739 RepID=C3YB66_BRAFL|nr:cysteine-rich receptor-like protein kinase 27 [Branchiostoma floridae]|eukprot:XP_002606518.1 hypothetical protein BRAFLDRAFT_91898 [Branchiostoma floridae]
MGKVNLKQRQRKRQRRKVKRKGAFEEKKQQAVEELEQHKQLVEQTLRDEKEQELEDCRTTIMIYDSDLSDPADGPTSLGAGSFGVVYLKRLRGANNSYVACKVVDSAARRADLRQEADLLARVCHRHWFPVLFGWNLDVAQPFLVQEFVSCPAGTRTALTLTSAMKHPAEPLLLKTLDFVLILTEVARGLVYLHGARILHNDLKHDNVMVTTRDKRIIAKIIDFGSACHAEQPAKFHVPTGMSTHIAPEVANGGAVTRLSNIYSYGRLVQDVEAVMKTGYPCMNQIATACFSPARADDRPDIEPIIRLLETAGH